MTVHSMPAPELQADPRRTRNGRIKMLLVLLVCAAPVLASYLSYFVLRPEGRTNYGVLIEPSRSLPALPLQTLDGQPVDAASLRGQWLLLALGPADCSGDCPKRLYLQRQLREMLGRERERIDKIWLVTDGAEPPPAPTRARADASPQALRRARRSPRLAAGRAPRTSYPVDPMGSG